MNISGLGAVGYLATGHEKTGQEPPPLYVTSSHRGCIMRKRGMLICFAIIAMLITGCGDEPIVRPLELSDAEEITAVEITTIDGLSCSCSDREWIEQFVSVISSVQATDKSAVQEHPASDYYGEFNILNGDKIIETIYYYIPMSLS